MTSGPKDWEPGPKPHRLSDEERARLDDVWKRALDGQRIPSEEVAWVCRLAMALDRPAYDEFRFPELLGLVNAPVGNAFWVRWKGKEVLRQRWESLGGLRSGRHVVFDHTVTAAVTEAVLIVRPYIRLESPDQDQGIAVLRRATVRFHTEEQNKEKTKTITTVIFPDDPLDDHLICPDGKVFRKLPYAFRLDGLNVFTAGLPVKEMVNIGASSSLMESAKVSHDLGFFVPNESRLVMAIDVPDPVEGTVALIAGLVASRYSTK